MTPLLGIDLVDVANTAANHDHIGIENIDDNAGPITKK